MRKRRRYHRHHCCAGTAGRDGSGGWGRRSGGKSSCSADTQARQIPHARRWMTLRQPEGADPVASVGQPTEIQRYRRESGESQCLRMASAQRERARFSRALNSGLAQTGARRGQKWPRAGPQTDGWGECETTPCCLKIIIAYIARPETERAASERLPFEFTRSVGLLLRLVGCGCV